MSQRPGKARRKELKKVGEAFQKLTSEPSRPSRLQIA